jgi:hypothetical protein
MKSHELKKYGQNKSEKEGGNRVIKNQIEKRKINKMLSQKSEKGREKT